MIGSLRPGRRGGPLPFVCLLSGGGGEGGGGGGGTRSRTVWEEGRGGAHVGERLQLREALVRGAPLTPVLAAFFGPPSRPLSWCVGSLWCLSLIFRRITVPGFSDYPSLPSTRITASIRPCIRPSIHASNHPSRHHAYFVPVTVLDDGDTDTNSHSPCLPSTVQETHKQVLGSQEY